MDFHNNGVAYGNEPDGSVGRRCTRAKKVRGFILEDGQQKEIDSSFRFDKAGQFEIVYQVEDLA